MCTVHIIVLLIIIINLIHVLLNERINKQKIAHRIFSISSRVAS